MPAAPLIVTFWDVGQGDCSTVTLPDGRLIIIDTGPRGSPLVDWLKEKRPRIHSLVLTHNDSDHAGALSAVLDASGDKLQEVRLLVDRPTKEKPFAALFARLTREEAAGRFSVLRLEEGAIIWEDASIPAMLKVVHPSMVQNIVASKPNATSAILSLIVRGRTEIVWPGDCSLRRTASKCSGMRPYLMVGPHHGAPEDYKGADGMSAITAIMPQQAFISVGTKNHYQHPRPKYLRRLEISGCRVVCSQLTYFCDRPRVLQIKQPVMEGHAALGLRPPRSGFACRGPLRLTLTNQGFVPSAPLVEQEHQRRIALLRRPQCLRGRVVWQKAQSLLGGGGAALSQSPAHAPIQQ